MGIQLDKMKGIVLGKAKSLCKGIWYERTWYIQVCIIADEASKTRRHQNAENLVCNKCGFEHCPHCRQWGASKGV